MIVECIKGLTWDDVEVRVDGKPLDPARSLLVWNHSPTGFSWGYGGSGPAQLALALLLEHGLSDAEATFHHQAFKRDWIAVMPQATCHTEIDMAEWVAYQADYTDGPGD